MAIMANSKLLFVVPVVGVFIQSSALAEDKFKPTLSTSLVGLTQNTPDGQERLGSLDVSPTLAFSDNGKSLSTFASVGGSFLTFNDSDVENQSYLSYNWRNQLKLLGDSIVVGVSTTQDYRVANTGLRVKGSFDKYNSSDRLVKSRSSQFTEAWKFERSAYWKLNADISLSDFRSDGIDELKLGDASTFEPTPDIDNQVRTINLQLDSRDRSRPFFWGIKANQNDTYRNVLGDLTTKSLYGVVGLPFFYTIKMIGQTRIEQNSGLTDGSSSSLFASAANYRSVGGGLEWQIGNQSYWNVTYNTLISDEGRKAYVATQLEFKPSRRTKLSANLDRRFFGRSAELSGEYNTQHLRIKLTGSDEVGSLLSLSSEGGATGLYVCPPGAEPSLDACYQPPTKDYIPQLGENYYNITSPSTDLNEFTVIRRSTNILIGYTFNRLKLQSQLIRRKDTFVNNNSVRDERSVSSSANYELNQKMSASLGYNYTDSSSDGSATEDFGTYAGKFNSWNLSLNRQLNKDLSGVLQISRSNNDFESQDLSFDENRITLTLSYSM